MIKIINHPHSYIGYQFFIEKDGTIHRGRLDTEEGAHCLGLNKCSIGIGLQGDFEKENPTPSQLASLKELIDKKKAEYNIGNSNVEGHRHFSNTSCPGKFLYAWLCREYPSLGKSNV